MKMSPRSALCVALLCFPATAHAQAPAPAKTVEIYVGSSVGAGYDLYARLLSRHIGRHLPGNPSVVVKNMDGAGGLRVANWLFGAAPKDGTVLGTFGRGIPFDNLLDPKKVTFDGRKFGWVGSMNNEVSVCVSWHTSGISTFDDVLARELTVGASGAGGDSVTFPTLLNALLGTRMRIISGYPGGNEISLALERGEVQGSASTLWRIERDWIRERKLNTVYQASLESAPDLPTTPTLVSLARNDDERRLLQFYSSYTTVGRSIIAPPKVPQDRVAALTAAFAATMKDADFRADAEKGKMELRVMSGEQLTALITDVTGLSGPLLARAKQISRGDGGK